MSEKPPKPERVVLLDPNAAGAFLGVSGKQIRNLCADGHFGQKIGGAWVIQAPELVWYRDNDRRRPGRPLNLAGETHGPEVED